MPGCIFGAITAGLLLYAAAEGLYWILGCVASRVRPLPDMRDRERSSCTGWGWHRKG